MFKATTIGLIERGRYGRTEIAALSEDHRHALIDGWWRRCVEDDEEIAVEWGWRLLAAPGHAPTLAGLLRIGGAAKLLDQARSAAPPKPSSGTV